MTLYSRANLSICWVRQQAYLGYSWLRQILLPAESADYIKWRHEFLYKRLSFGIWIGLACFLLSSSHGLYLYIVEFDQLQEDLDRFFEAPWIAETLRSITITGFFIIVGLIGVCLWLHRTRFGKRYPAIIFLIFACAVNGFVTQVISTFYGVPIQPDTTIFLALAVLLPLRWPLHLISQLLPIVYYTVVLPLLGINGVGNISIFNSVYSAGTFIEIGWVCLICNVGVYVYERLRRSEFESRRELQIFLHTISHDLRNPVMGSSMVVKNLLNKAADGYAKVSAPVLERLLQGSDRQLALINALVEAYHADGKGITLHCQPVQFSTVVETVLADIEPKRLHNKVELHNTIDPNFPLVRADPTHLWRVLSNLIDNALKHNPPGIHLTLSADVIKAARCSTTRDDLISSNPQSLPQPFHKKISNIKSLPMLLCRVQDDGIGIPRSQCQRLFELYSRGQRARYMPGLGLGLYLCQQIVTAHGGEIGVISQPDIGSTFWFTLPLDTSVERLNEEKVLV